MKNRELAIHVTVIRAHLDNDAFVKFCLRKLVEQQEPDEQSIEETLYDNSRGFTYADAAFLTKCAKDVEKLHPYELVEIRKRLYKYTTQLGKLISEDDVYEQIATL
jgi:hypothetical protein